MRGRDEETGEKFIREVTFNFGRTPFTANIVYETEAGKAMGDSRLSSSEETRQVTVFDESGHLQ